MAGGRRRNLQAAAALAILAASCASGGYDDSGPFGPAQGNGSSLIRRNAGVLVDPAGRYAWVQHHGSLFAVSTSSGAVSTVYSLAGLYDVRLAFLPGDEAVLVTNDPYACPFATNACTRVTHLDTLTATAGAERWEGSTLDFSVQSPSGRFIALSGGFAASGVFLVDASDDLRPVEWESLPGGSGWSTCLPRVESCEERLWMVGRHAIHSWPVIGGVLADEPDLSFPAECDASYSVVTADGSLQTQPLVAASRDGHWVALTCGRTFSLFDAVERTLRPTELNGPVSFAGNTIVGHVYEDGGSGYYDTGEPCLQFIDPQVPLGGSTECFPTTQSVSYYVTSDGEYVVASSYNGLYVLRDGYVGELAGISLLDGAFVERVGHSEIWFASAQQLYALPLDGFDPYDDLEPAVVELSLSVPVDDLNILPSQDELAILSSGSLVFFSMVTGSSESIALP